MAQFLGFGNGTDGDLVISGNTTDSPIDSSCSGTAGTRSLSATNASFAAGQMILIHQSRGTGAGAWEINQISSYSAGTITTTFNLANTYTDSGASQAQVLVLKQYRSVTVNSGVTWTVKGWDGNVGGILAVMASGTVSVAGTINASAKGYRTTVDNNRAGEGTAGDPVPQFTANGNGGGGAGSEAKGGGGGGNGVAGSAGGVGSAGGEAAEGGSAVGSADLTTMTFGGAGGSSFSPATGGAGGGLIVVYGGAVTVTGAMTSNGANGGNGDNAGVRGGGGGGAGGSILIKTRTATLGSSLITATGGTGGSPASTGGAGGNGGVGRIRVDGCAISGTTNPSASTTTGNSWCGGAAFVF